MTYTIWNIATTDLPKIQVALDATLRAYTEQLSPGVTQIVDQEGKLQVLCFTDAGIPFRCREDGDGGEPDPTAVFDGVHLTDFDTVEGRIMAEVELVDDELRCTEPGRVLPGLRAQRAWDLWAAYLDAEASRPKPIPEAQFVVVTRQPYPPQLVPRGVFQTYDEAKEYASGLHNSGSHASVWGVQP